MKEFVISSENADMRLDKFMSKVMLNISMGEVYKSLRKKKVRVNGKHRDGSYRLLKNDVVCMYINDEFFKSDQKSFSWEDASTEVDVVYEDKNIIIANKPSGMPSQDIDGNRDSLESRIRAYLLKTGGIDLDAVPLFVPSLCHRIDRNTSGLVIAAKNSAAQRIINQKIKNKEIRKFYICETQRTPNPESGQISGYLYKSGKDRKMLFSKTKTENSDFCETFYKTIKKGTPATVEVEIKTGRTHQIRVCLSHIGCPLVGDVKYGAKYDGGKEYQRLTAYKLVFEFKTDGGELNYLNGKTVEI